MLEGNGAEGGQKKHRMVNEFLRLMMKRDLGQ